MKLKVLLPTEVLIEKEVTKVIAEAEDGSFCLKPKHIDFVAALEPGLLSFETTDGREEFLAVDEGTLVKCGAEVLVSTANAVRGPNLGKLKDMVEKQFMIVGEKQKSVRSAVAKLEANLVRKFIDLGHE
ncbi:MAG: F0F1 ATP synthase subunit epsilon [Candidatus Scalindua sp. AMX11]|nr:MAG: F0F1 ATP synthase subunit epsilon [Candidatus Scalindua sp.]NOG84690.1 F0F1 ATP synthase subunit epsilon [Planctomycetota bacterium]RZV98304.1 MAG: F0F1 ATP synthase subunit epsilon [Candidatus Scalindua sp. SCAELEC01]TDE66604.1 MAG: F0F1 ATP synthase subunit epsilon [Candidatus Scalindua sp. AMX11]GJQ58980.1 MAG: F0F1 ATP synthase subunit epsilon [Candidatus Scalindua sp.]